MIDPDLNVPRMTARERDVVMLALKGMTARQIGAKLFIADRTVETHPAHAYSKLGVRSRFELIARLSDGATAGNGGGANHLEMNRLDSGLPD
jgi:DNA-binding CsgD family transcriptional regulator